MTLAQHWTKIGSMFRVCWVIINTGAAAFLAQLIGKAGKRDDKYDVFITSYIHAPYVNRSRTKDDIKMLTVKLLAC